MTLADRLKTARGKHGHSMEEAAEACQVSRTAYRTWEIGAGEPKARHVKPIATYCRVQPTTILKDLEETFSKTGWHRRTASAAA